MKPDKDVVWLISPDALATYTDDGGSSARYPQGHLLQPKYYRQSNMARHGNEPIGNYS